MAEEWRKIRKREGQDKNTLLHLDAVEHQQAAKKKEPSPAVTVDCESCVQTDKRVVW